MHIASVLEPFAPVISLIDGGRFKEARSELRPLPTRKSSDERAVYDVLRARVDLECGDLGAAVRAADRISNRDDSWLVAHSATVLAWAKFTLGDFRASRNHIRRAIAAADETGLAALRADVRIRAFRMSLRTERLATTGSDLTDLKRLVAHTGNPHLMAMLRGAVAQAEARSNSLSEAHKHLLLARELLDSYPNPWLEGLVELDLSTVTALRGQTDKSLGHAERALQYAERSGHFQSKIASLINTSHLLADRGDYAEAESHVKSALALCDDHPQLLLAALDSRANILITSGNYQGAERVFREVDKLLPRLGAGRLHWDTLTESYSKARLAIAVRHWQDAEKHLEEGFRQAVEFRDNFWLSRIGLLRLKCRAFTGTRVRRDELSVLSEIGNYATLDTLAQRHDAIAAVAQSSDHLSRAIRLAEATGNRNLIHDTEAGYTSEQIAAAQREVPPPTLESAAALIELAGHPHVLAREALALIAGARCTHGAAIVAHGQTDVRVLETRDWDERDALNAAHKADDAETIDCGTHGDERLQIVARPHDDLERRCTFIAIRKLVATAVSLDRYRRDEKQRAALWPTESLDGDPDAIWVSEQSTELLRVARRIAITPLTVLVTGESGTGKEMMARAIHAASERPGKLLGFNCTAVPRDMFESQLFGYRRGSFTGAESTFGGIIRAAEGGTLFLDEIADVPRDVQPKLLRFLETHEIHPLGEPHPIKVDVRVIAATNVDLEPLVADGRFREDLFYRLNVVRLRMPPLRERREEIPALVEHYVRKYGTEQKKGHLTISDEILEYLLLYPWPGNIRQLANEVNRIVAMAEPDAILTAAHLSAEIQSTRKTVAASPATSAELRISLDQTLPAAVEYLERTMVESALSRTKGRLEEAAKILGISRKGLFLKRRRWGLDS